MRPLYESALDLERERAVIEQLAWQKGVSYTKLPLDYRVDYALHQHRRISAIAEVKCRRNRSDVYPSLILSAKKFHAGLELSERMGVPFLVVAGWEDGIFYYKAGNEPLDYDIGGRVDRNDPQDVEIVVHLPVNRFQPVVLN